MKKKIIYLLFASFVLTTACKNDTKQQDQTPVAQEELEDLEPDMTFNDIDTVLDRLDEDPEYNSLLKLVNQAQMFDALGSLEDVTFFAPTNAAVNRLPEATYTELRKPENLSRLQAILKYHIVEGEQDAATLISTIQAKDTPLRLQTLNGGYIALTLNEGKIIITDEDGSTAEVSQPDIEASNGVIHGVSNILIPNKS